MLLATSKSGGGTQGREVRSKAVKNKFKGRGGANKDSDDEDTPPVAATSKVRLKLTSCFILFNCCQVNL